MQYRLGTMRAVTTAVVIAVALATAVSTTRAAATGPKPAFDWTQFLKGVKRAATTDVEPSSEELDIDYQDSQFQVKPIASNPMSPFLSMKPFLPMRPTFMPPVVDPQFFINKKTALLNGLFSPAGPAADETLASPPFGGVAMVPNYFTGKKTSFLSTLFSQLATPPPQTVTNKTTTNPGDGKVIQRRLVAPWLTTPPPFDPKVMTDKKTAFLDKLFSSINSATPDADALDTATLKPTIVPPEFWLPFAAKSNVAIQPTVKPTIVPPDFWLPFAAKSNVAIQPTAKPTIVPPGFWFPFATSKSAGTPAKPVGPIVDPSVFVDKKTTFLNDLMSSLNSLPNPTEPPTHMADATAYSTSDSASMEDVLSEFLDKLMVALTTPTLMIKRAVMDESDDPRKRSAPLSAEAQQPESPPLNAKDKVMNTFIGELSGIKNNILDTVTQMIKAQKESAKVAPLPGMKPGKKVGPPFAGLWGPMAKPGPTPDPTIPFEQKIDVLNQVFDMLTDLQKDVVTALNEAQAPAATQGKNNTNTTILDLLRKKFVEMSDGNVNSPPQMYGAPLKYSVRDADGLQESDTSGSKTRSITMGVHQGYQSLPPGTTELLQAGGGSIPQGKEGGGIKLQKEDMNLFNSWESRHHHHNDK